MLKKMLEDKKIDQCDDSINTKRNITGRADNQYNVVTRQEVIPVCVTRDSLRNKTK
jgi:hypothetical protein